MRYKKQYLGDITSTIVPKNLNRYARLAQIISTDSEKGTCTIRFIDIPSIRSEVILLQASSGIYNLPNEGDIVVVVFDVFERPYIVGYINLGHESKVKKLNTLPKFKPGEKFFEAGGSYFYIRKNGNIVISTLFGNYIEIENQTGNIKFETVNWKVITEGGILYFGLVKRFVKDEEGNVTYKPITNFAGDSYTELNLKVMETADGTLGIDQNAEPLIDLTLGTLVDDDGNKINANGDVAIKEEKEILLKLKIKNGIQIDIDKEGKASIKGVKLNLNKGSVDADDPDIVLGLEKNNASLGTKGQHAAREHDKVTIPISAVFEDTEHLGLVEKSSKNILTLQKLATAFISPTGPCIFNPSILSEGENLEGEITEGAKNFYIGDE